MIREIKKERFEALSYGRLPFIQDIATEIEWYSNESETLLGIVLFDEIDYDFSFVICGRDETGIFRAIDLGTCFETKKEAKKVLFEKILKHGEAGTKEFPQGDRKSGRQLIFEPISPDSELHPHFKVLLQKELYSSAREIITEIAYAFKDPDGNYVQQFQTTGFNSRLWELFLFAFFHEQSFLIHRDNEAPDFHLEKYGHEIFVEAVTVNPSSNMPNKPSSAEEKRALIQDFVPIRFGSSLYSKLNRQKKYWEMEHVKGHPFILAVHDYLFDDSMIWTRAGLERYLYGLDYQYHYDEKGKLIIKTQKIIEHTWEGKTIPSSFFTLPNSDNVSAVLFSNNATVSTFNRMGFIAGFGNQNIKMVRMGTSYDSNPNAAKPKSFSKEVHNASYTEKWGEAVIMFHNPNAKIPVNPNLFPGIAHAHLVKDQMICDMPNFYPFNSETFIFK